MNTHITKKTITVCALLISLIDVVCAQQTGLFQKSFTFTSPYAANQSRQIAYWVPANYSATKKYKLFISLGGQGWAPMDVLKEPTYKASGMVDLLLAASACSSTYGDFIAVSPSQSPQAYAAGLPHGTWPWPEGVDEGLPEAIIKLVKAGYNIDTNYVYLTGFSLGGRGALMLGLESYKKLRGIMLFTPAVQGIKEAKNLNSYQLTVPYGAYYNYSAAKNIPICMTVGANDPNGGGCPSCTPPDPVVSYITIAAEIKNQFTIAGAGSTSQHTVISGWPHLPPPPSGVCNCYNFIEAHTVTAINPVEETNDKPLIYPNPATGVLNFNREEFAPIAMGFTQEEIEIYNVMGQCVLKQILTSANLQINVSYLPAGAYSVYMKNHPEVTQKFIKQ